MKYLHNPIANPQADYPECLKKTMGIELFDEALEEISQWQGYQPTPLHQLQYLASRLGIGDLYYKDEAGRFGLGSFKALGGAYAVLKLLQREVSNTLGRQVSNQEIRSRKHDEIIKNITICSATDGNHGRSVAWGCQQFGCACKIYIHSEVSQGREQAIQAYAADVIRIKGNYDESVRLAAADSAANNWFVVSDTSYEGYMDVPRYVMAGYTVMAAEIVNEIAEQKLTHVFIQAGVGGVAAALCAYMWQALQALEIARPQFVIVEPQRAACLMLSMENKQITDFHITEETMMAGLSCGEVSQLAWPVLIHAASHFITINDDQVAPMMRLLAKPESNDPAIEAGESAVAGLAAMVAAKDVPQVWQSLGLDQNSRVLLLGTEGATDAEIYQQIVETG